MTKQQLKQKNDSLAGGLVLIGIGGAFLFFQNVSMPDAAGILVLPLLALIFMVAGVVKREVGYMVPGGILGGIGLGTGLIVDPLSVGWLNSIDEGALFMFSFAAGWLSITLMSTLFANEKARWPLIPATIMTLVGATVLNESLLEPVWEAIGMGWPLVLIAIGVWSLIQTAGSDQIK